jgi:hypothetical protein
MKIKDVTIGLKPSTTILVCVAIAFFGVLIFANTPYFNPRVNNFGYLINIFYKSEIFAYLGFFSIILLISRGIKVLDLSIKSTEWFENRKRIAKGWPTKEEEVTLESIFYSGISFDELYRFIQFIYNIGYIAFTENSQATVQTYTLLARNDNDGYWLSYFRFSQREAGRIKMLYAIISNFMEVLTGDPSYKKELKDQAISDPELKNVDTEKLLIGILDKEYAKKIYYICEKYYKMIIDKRVEKKSLEDI